MIDGINLTDAYLRRKMEVVPATSEKPVASIRADGTKKGLRKPTCRTFGLCKKSAT